MAVLTQCLIGQLPWVQLWGRELSSNQDWCFHMLSGQKGPELSHPHSHSPHHTLNTFSQTPNTYKIIPTQRSLTTAIMQAHTRTHTYTHTKYTNSCIHPLNEQHSYRFYIAHAMLPARTTSTWRMSLTHNTLHWCTDRQTKLGSFVSSVHNAPMSLYMSVFVFVCLSVHLLVLDLCEPVGRENHLYDNCASNTGASG